MISWLSSIDDGLLRYMARHEGLELTPLAWHHNLSKEQQASHSHIKRRIKKLEEAGLVYRVDGKHGYYGISELGVRYVNGEVSREKMEAINPDPEPEPGPDDGDGNGDDAEA